MRAIISGEGELEGNVHLPGSKAYTHRALIGALLSDGETVIRGPSVCDDIEATLGGIAALGAQVSSRKDTVSITGAGDRLRPSRTVDCGESGATLRFLSSIGTLASSETVLLAGKELAARPIQPLLDALQMIGGSTSLDGSTLRVHGPLRGGTARITGSVSSQFVSGLLFASPYARDHVSIRIEGQLQSKPYVEMTLEVLRTHGIRVDTVPGGYEIPAPQTYRPADHDVPRDFSSASFLLTAVAATRSRAGFLGLGTQNDRLEPDHLIVDLLQNVGAGVDRSDHYISVSAEDELRGFDFDATDNPDLVPPLEVLACYAKGKSRITGTERLRYKESDRLASVPSELRKLGARMRVHDGTVEIEGMQKLRGASLSSHSDHRVVMACAVAGLGAAGTTIVDGVQAVSKSYPGFFDDLASLGADIDVE